MNWFLKIIIEKPKYVLLLSFIVFLAASQGCYQLTFSTNYRIFFSEKNPHLQAFEALQKTYTKNDNVLFVISANEGDVFQKDFLLALQNLTQKAWTLPYSIRVDSITNFQYTHAKEDELVVGDFIETPSALNAKMLEQKKQLALNEPQLVNRLLSENARVTAVNVTFQLPGVNDAIEVPRVAEAARALQAEFAKKHPQWETHLTGVVMQNYAFTEASVKDSMTLMPFMFIMIIVGVGVFFKSFSASLLVFIMMIFGILPAMGIAGWLNVKLNTATMAAPIMILTLSVADTVHLLSNFFQNYTRHRKKEALIQSLKINIQPITLTSITTMLGFLSLNFSDAPPFHDLGNIVALGVGWACLFSLTTLPALILYLPIKPHSVSKHPPFMMHLSKFVLFYRRALFWGFGGLACLMIAFIPKNELNDQWVNYFSKDMAFRQATDYTLEHLTGVGTLHYDIKSQGSYGITSTTYLKHLESLTQWLKNQSEIIHVSSLSDTMKRLNQNMHGDDPRYYKVPEDEKLAAQYLLLYEMSLPFGLDLNHQINLDKSATRVQATLKKLSTNELLALEERIQAYQVAHLPEEMRAQGTSPDVMFAYIGFTNIRSMLWGTTFALLGISVLLIVAFRSWRYGLLSLLPNLLPPAFAFGLWGMWVGEIGLSLSVVTGMALGIIVDDTIHFISKYLRALKTKTPAQAIQYAFETVGFALVTTSFVLILGFGVLSFSAFELNASMGFLTAVIIFVALVYDLLFLPPCLLFIHKKVRK